MDTGTGISLALFCDVLICVGLCPENIIIITIFHARRIFPLFSFASMSSTSPIPSLKF
jgi:hypothetical protein